jgi:hypothetical protein
MKLKEIVDRILKEERNGGHFENYRAEVGEDEGEYLIHFHLFHKDDSRKNTAIMLDKPFYFLHGKYKYVLNAKEKKQFIAWINSTNINGEITSDKDGNLPKNNWENLRNCWNAISKNKINCFMPDYNLLFKNYK